MVDIVKPSTPLQDLQQATRKELRGMMIDAAKRIGCHPEELRIRVVRNNITGLGGYEVERITEDEMVKMHHLEILKRTRKQQIKKRGR